jgi:hypothetical protein
MSGLEEVDAAYHLKGCILNKIARIEVAACRRRQPAVSPPRELRQAPLQDRFQCGSVTGLRLDHQ